MEGWERNGDARNAGLPLGISKRSGRIAKNARRGGGAIHNPNRRQQQQHHHHHQQQQQQEAQPPPVYNINKNDFRNVVQRLTGSPSAEPFPSPPPPPPRPEEGRGSSSRLQKMRPPPLGPLSAAPPFQKPCGMATPPLFSPLPPLTPGDAAWANPAESPVSAYMRYLQQSMANPSPRAPLLQSPRPPFLQSPPPALPSPAAQFLVPSPLPSPFNMGAYYFARSPSAQLGAESPLLPPSPGLFPLSPAGRFASSENPSAAEGFPFPDRNRRP